MIKKNGFTLTELMTVVAVIGILATMVVVINRSIRSDARDMRRIHDVQEIQSALEFYYNRNNSYPTLITPGESLAFGDIKYIDPVPKNPTPQNDGNCGFNEYTYAVSPNNNNYHLNFCLGEKKGAASKGSNVISRNGLNIAPGLVGWWKFEEGGDKYVDDITGNNNVCDIKDELKINYFWTASSDCKTGACGQFDGTTDLYVDCGIKNDFIVNSGSMSLWFNLRHQMNGPYDFNIMQIGNGDIDNNEIGLKLEGSTIKLTGYKNSSQIIDLSIDTFESNTWYYIVGTWDINGANLYIKGPNKDSTVNISGDTRLNLTNNMTQIAIGAAVKDSSQNFDGYIDDVRIYNRSLSANEIQAVYDSLK